MKTIILIATLFLTGCAGQMVQNAKDQCAQLGYTPGTQEHARCAEVAFLNRRRELTEHWSRIGAASQPRRIDVYGW